MNLLQNIEHWGDTHHPKWLDLVRIALGLFLCFKGYQFLENMSSMISLMSDNISFIGFSLVLVGHYIIFAHLLGGFLLAIGILTRFAAVIQIPILLGAIIFINSSQDFLRPFSELLLSIMVLLLLIYFLIAGNGPWSFNRYVDEGKIK